MGFCAIEAKRYDLAVQRGLEEVGKASWGQATPEEQAKIASWAEAWVYQIRVLAYVLLRMAEEVDGPSHANLVRYQTAATNALAARWAELRGEEWILEV